MSERDEMAVYGPRHSSEFWQFEYEPVGQLPGDIPVFAASERVPTRLIDRYGGIFVMPSGVFRVGSDGIAVTECALGELAIAGEDKDGSFFLLRSKQKDGTSEQKHLLRDARGGVIGGSKTRINQWSYLVSTGRFHVAQPRKKTNQRTRFMLAVINRDRFLLPRGIYYAHFQPPLAESVPAGTMFDTPS